MIFENIVLVCDMDGTLLNSLDKISPENKAAMEYFVDNGGKLTVATGRKETSVQPFLSEIPINTPAIVYNGSVIFDFEKNVEIWEMELHGGIQEVLLEVTQRFPAVGVEIYKGSNILLVKENSFTEFHRKKECYPYVYHSIEMIDFPWRKVLLAAEPEELTRVETFLAQRYREGELPFGMCRSERFFLEWLPYGVSKGKALHILRQEHGFLNHKVVTVGNETNDLTMLRPPFIGFAVANAHPEAKLAASYGCAHHDAHAIAEVVTRIENTICKED